MTRVAWIKNQIWPGESVPSFNESQRKTDCPILIFFLLGRNILHNSLNQQFVTQRKHQLQNNLYHLNSVRKATTEILLLFLPKTREIMTCFNQPNSFSQFTTIVKLKRTDTALYLTAGVNLQIWRTFLPKPNLLKQR